MLLQRALGLRSWCCSFYRSLAANLWTRPVPSLGCIFPRRTKSADRSVWVVVATQNRVACCRSCRCPSPRACVWLCLAQPRTLMACMSVDTWLASARDPRVGEAPKDAPRCLWRQYVVVRTPTNGAPPSVASAGCGTSKRSCPDGSSVPATAAKRRPHCSLRHPLRRHRPRRTVVIGRRPWRRPTVSMRCTCKILLSVRSRQ
mmetsp:Transcript_87896/g.246888  ORF Transcript_87896/g.246888 Transcript_87896/m.246888 type:complete len:202 (-) Transcript_87896:176-781(-)